MDTVAILVIICALVICIGMFLYWLFKKKLNISFKLPKRKEKTPKVKKQ